MIDSRSNHSKASSIKAARLSPAPSRQQVSDSAPPPRWGLLVAAIVAAVVTASWVASDLSTADADLAQAQSAQAQGR